MRLAVVLIGVAALILLSRGTQAQAQQTTSPSFMKLVYSGYSPDFLHWTWDSMAVYFDHSAPPPNNDSIISPQPYNGSVIYNVKSATTSVVTSNAQLTPLSTQENTVFAPLSIAGLNGPVDSLQYVSPDGHYVVYSGGLPIKGGDFTQYSIRLGNRQTRQSIDTQIRTDDPTDESSFYVVWNYSSTAFAVRNARPELFATFGGYVTGFQTDLTSLTVKPLMDFSLNNISYEVYNPSANLALYGVAANQSFILTDLTKTPQQNTDDPEIRLALVNVDSPGQTHIFPQLDATHIPAASFSASSENILWVITENGLVIFDVTTGKEIVVDPVVNSEWAHTASFSPDRTMLAVIHQRFDSSNPEIYVGKLPLIK